MVDKKAITTLTTIRPVLFFYTTTLKGGSQNVPVPVHGKMYGCRTTGVFYPFAPESQGNENIKNSTMEKEQRINRNKRIYIRLTATEYEKLHNGFARTILRKFSEYNRNLILNRPVTIFTRNKSYDEFVEEMAALRAELNAIGNNFNQLVKKLHTLTHDEEIKAWALLNEKSKELFYKKLDEIELKMIQIAGQWSQE
jgi:hypothetical protein